MAFTRYEKVETPSVSGVVDIERRGRAFRSKGAYELAHEAVTENQNINRAVVWGVNSFRPDRMSCSQRYIACVERKVVF